jgi:hypothetical protein
MTARSFIAMALAYLVPGAGHLYLRRYGRAAAYFCIVVFMFVTGLAIDGGLYTLRESQGALLRLLASAASMGSGLMYFIATKMGPFGKVTSMTYEYGTTFTLTAGLMNLLLVLDCFDIVRGRKP